MTRERPRFSSRFALLASMLGIAVGTGNIWRFPRVAAQSGGSTGAGAFLIAWAICLMSWSIPLIVAEYAMGRAARQGVVGSFAHIAGPKWAPMGAFVSLVAIGIMFYYSVVAGWCLYYLGHTVCVPLPRDAAAAAAVWSHMHASGAPVACHLLAFGLCGWAVHRGVASIERVNKVLIPVLLVIVGGSVARALTLPGAVPGLSFLFAPHWASLANPETWLEALTQNAWDTGAGWGLILGYAAYMRQKDAVVKNAVITAVGNNVVSLLAAIMVFSTVFAILGPSLEKADILQVMQDSGPASTGLTFVWMPQLFAQMTGGRIVAVLFFVGLSCAAMTSLISMVELGTRVLIDAGMRRRRALLLVVSVGFVLGVPSAVNVTFLSNQDFVWGVGLIISGAFVAVAVVRHGVARLRREVLDQVGGDWRLGTGWQVTLAVLVPLQALVLIGWWIYRSATSYAPDSWYDPFDPYSVATCLLQWGVGLGLCFVAGRRLIATPGRKG